VTSQADVRRFVLERLAERLEAAGIHPDEVTEETDLFADGIVDSLEVMETIAAVSHEFGVDDDWEDYDPDDLLVLGRFCRYVESRSTGRD
jgi:acyl carrier protein